MNKDHAVQLICTTLEQPFDEERYLHFVGELLNEMDASKTFIHRGNYIPKSFRSFVSQFKRLGTYTDPDGHTTDVLIVYLKKETSLHYARTMQRNFIARHLKMRDAKDAALVAYASPDLEDWRFSLVRMEYQLAVDEETGKVKPEEKLTPARRFSFLVGENEPNHTAQQQLVSILENDRDNPTLEALEKAFDIETVTKRFFKDYKERFLELQEELERVRVRDSHVGQEFIRKGLGSANFAKKLLGQIVFLYFIQKKGWLGVERGQPWGSGPKDFLPALFANQKYENFFDEILEPLFYEALAVERPDHVYPRLNCKIPFLNGGLFEPTGGYDWQGTEILIDNAVFENIFATFDLYNFTVREDEPLEKEVAVDPEMLGKVFENLLEVRDRKSKGAFYTPREIVHYMCQESLINYLDTALNLRPDPLAQKPPVQDDMFAVAKPTQETMAVTKYDSIVPRGDIETLIRKGELALQHEAAREAGASSYEAVIPASVRAHARELDEALADVKICDPAIGSGAFPVGMMHEIVRAREALTTYLNSPLPLGRQGVQSKGLGVRAGERTTYNLKRHAIQYSLYGVDIDLAAVDIAKLRLWLSLVVDEEDYKNIKPLPNLDYKIVAGNSLLGYPYQRRGLEKLEALKDDFFDEIDPIKRQILRTQIDQELAEIYKNTKKSLGYQVTVDFKINFSEVFREKGGFDIVIGNPPYIKEYVNRTAFDGLRNSPYYKGKMDIWYLFACVGLDIVRKKKGIVTLIAQNNWVTSYGASKMRNKVIRDAQIINLIDFGNLKVFEAGIQTMIMIFRRRVAIDDYSFDYRKLHGKELEFEDAICLLNQKENPKTKYLT
ncbi:MAG: Eco57I restriction-modification methylase domain-containing protein, partial [Chloroflexota bacterium]|nr:Eco57I restriction-modification methylase domain-containing protein [Chloroflexota bacterium]